MSSNRQADARPSPLRAPLLFLAVGALLLLEGSVSNAMFSGSWNSALSLLNMGLISAVAALGVNMIWGYGGLFNAGVVGFIGLGGLAPVLISTPPVAGAWDAGGPRMMLALAVGLATMVLIWAAAQRLRGVSRGVVITLVIVAGYVATRMLFDPAVAAIEANNPAKAGNIGGLGLPVVLSWPVGMVLAAAAAWGIGKVALGLRSDYLAIATLGIGEIIVAILKNEGWLARGVLNVTGIPRPVPYELALQSNPEFVVAAARWGMDTATASGVYVKLCYAAIFIAVVLTLILLTELALYSPWGRMMRAIRDNEVAAAAMGKNVTRRHLQLFVLGCAVIGLSGAMMVTLDGLMAPGGYNPLRYTFLVWVMVIVGGSGNNWGAVLGAILIWFLWIKAEVWGPAAMAVLTSPLAEGGLRAHLIESAPQMRYLAMGVVLLLVLRFAPRGLLPER